MSDQEEGEIVEDQQHLPKRSKTFDMKSGNYRTKVCEHFKKGNCKHGEACPFIHPANFVLPVCKYYKAGQCNKQKCDYSHDYQCKYYYGNGKCQRPVCAFSHKPFNSKEATFSWIKDNFNHLYELYRTCQTMPLYSEFEEYIKLNHPEIKLQRKGQFPNPNMIPIFTQAKANMNIPLTSMQAFGQMGFHPYGNQVTTINMFVNIGPSIANNLPHNKQEDDEESVHSQFSKVTSESVQENDSLKSLSNSKKQSEIQSPLQVPSAQQVKEQKFLEKKASIIHQLEPDLTDLQQDDWTLSDLIIDAPPTLLQYLLGQKRTK